MSRRLVLTGRIDEYGTFLQVVGKNYCVGLTPGHDAAALNDTFQMVHDDGTYARAVHPTISTRSAIDPLTTNVTDEAHAHLRELIGAFPLTGGSR